MKQTVLSQNGRALLSYANSRLSPDIFSHPVWVRFGQSKHISPPSLIEDLCYAARETQPSDPGSACQILLLCAVYQNYTGQHFSALKTTQQVQALAGQYHLAREIIWAIWGASAIAFQQRDFETATAYLADLQTALGTADEWVLASFIDVLRQWLLRPELATDDESQVAPASVPSEGMLGIVSDWLQHWGSPPPSQGQQFGNEPAYPESQANFLSATMHSFLSIQYWRGRWRSLMLAIRGELKLQWVTRQTPSRERPDVWRQPILSSQPADQPIQKIDLPAPPVLQLAAPMVLPPKERAGAGPTTSKKKQGSVGSKSGKKPRAQREATSVSVIVHMLGVFRLSIGDISVKLPASRGVSLLKYLLLHHKQAIPRDVLMEVFWPDAELETARNSLNVAMHNLRKALRSVVFLPVIAFDDGCYRLEGNLQVWLDVEEFERCVKAGQQLEARGQLAAAVTEYEAAVSLYQGDFLEANPYEEWTILERERLRIAYLDTLDRLSQIYFEEERYSACRSACQLVLMRDPCREDAHCLLMRCYSRQGQHHLALRQYQLCVEALRMELDVEPAPETEELFEHIRQRDPI